MDKPSLTPHTDEVEKVLPAFIEALRRDAVLPNSDRVAAELSEMILPAVMRAVAYQQDRRVARERIAVGFYGAMANTIMSIAGTLTNCKDVSPMLLWNVAVFMQNIDGAINQRFSDPDLESMATMHEYSNPDRAPGNA